MEWNCDGAHLYSEPFVTTYCFVTVFFIGSKTFPRCFRLTKWSIVLYNISGLVAPPTVVFSCVISPSESCLNTLVTMKQRIFPLLKSASLFPFPPMSRGRQPHQLVTSRILRGRDKLTYKCVRKNRPDESLLIRPLEPTGRPTTDDETKVPSLPRRTVKNVHRRVCPQEDQ